MNSTSYNRPQINFTKLGLVVLALILLLVAAGCSRNGTDQTSEMAKSMRMVTDCLGRQVEVPVNPERIACTCPEAGYAMAMYGKGDRIVATTDGMQREVLLLEMYPHLKGLPVPKKGGVINIEELIRIKADLIFVKPDTVTNEAEMNKLQVAKIPVVAIQFVSMEEQQYTMQMLATILGAEEEGRQYQQFYQDKIAMVQSRVATLPDDKRARVYHSTQEATRTDTVNTLGADWTRAAGVINVSVGQDLKLTDGDHFASLEQILLWDPDYILANNPDVVGYIMSSEQWRPLKAVKNQRVLPLPVGLTRWGHENSPETPLAILWAAKTVYPDLFADISMEAAVHDFYQEFFDWELDQDTISRILKSQGMRTFKS